MKYIKEYEGLYSITEDGRVWSHRRMYEMKNYNHHHGGRFIKLKINSQGYFYATLHKNGNRKNFKVHRLVAEAYIPNPENKPQVNHKTGDKTKNGVNDIEWMTAKENTRHYWSELHGK